MIYTFEVFKSLLYIKCLNTSEFIEMSKYPAKRKKRLVYRTQKEKNL